MTTNQKKYTLDEIFKAFIDSEKADEAVVKATAKADKLEAKRKALIRDCGIENVLYKDDKGKTWFFNGWSFTEVNG